MNVDENEIAKFAELADKWWDKEGDFKPLHKINPLRANYIDSIASVEAKTFLEKFWLLQMQYCQYSLHAEDLFYAMA